MGDRHAFILSDCGLSPSCAGRGEPGMPLAFPYGLWSHFLAPLPSNYIRASLTMNSPNVHIYNSAISACARCNLWEKGYELFREMDDVSVLRDVVTYNAVLDAVSSQIQLGRKLFQEGEIITVMMTCCSC
jgi:pentatricopeptide repeat protein